MNGCEGRVGRALVIYNKVPFGVLLDHWEKGTLLWNLMVSPSFPKTVSQCQRWEKIISLHTLNESQRLSQPFLREGYYSPRRLPASLINFSQRIFLYPVKPHVGTFFVCVLLRFCIFILTGSLSFLSCSLCFCPPVFPGSPLPLWTLLEYSHWLPVLTSACLSSALCIWSCSWYNWDKRGHRLKNFEGSLKAPPSHLYFDSSIWSGYTDFNDCSEVHKSEKKSWSRRQSLQFTNQSTFQHSPVIMSCW